MYSYMVFHIVILFLYILIDVVGLEELAIYGNVLLTDSRLQFLPLSNVVRREQ